MLGGVNPLWPWTGHFGSRAEWVWYLMALILSGDISLAPTSGPSGISGGIWGVVGSVLLGTLLTGVVLGWSLHWGWSRWGPNFRKALRKRHPWEILTSPQVHPEKAGCVLPKLWTVQPAQLSGVSTEPTEETQIGQPRALAHQDPIFNNGSNGGRV